MFNTGPSPDVMSRLKRPMNPPTNPGMGMNSASPSSGGMINSGMGNAPPPGLIQSLIAQRQNPMSSGGMGNIAPPSTGTPTVNFQPNMPSMGGSIRMPINVNSPVAPSAGGPKFGGMPPMLNNQGMGPTDMQSMWQKYAQLSGM